MFFLTLFHFFFKQNCYQVAGTYGTGTVEDSGTLYRVLNERKLRIGFINGTFTPLANSSSNNALVELEERVFDWVGKIHGESDQTFSLDPIIYNSGEEVFDALEKGEIDMTGSLFWEGGYFPRTRELLRSRFRPSCSVMSFGVNFTVLSNSSKFSDYHSLLDYKGSLTISAHGFSSHQFVEEFFNRSKANVTILKRFYLEHSVEDLNTGLADAAVFIYMDDADVHSLGFRNIVTPHILPFCSFFRRDKVIACGDSVVDIELGEECEINGAYCSQCKCSSLRDPDDPPRLDCMSGLYDFVLWFTLTSSIILLALTVGMIWVFCVMPKMRKKYMAMGETRMKYLLISDRFGSTPAESEMDNYSSSSSSGSLKKHGSVIIPSPIAPPRSNPKVEDDK